MTEKKPIGLIDSKQPNLIKAPDYLMRGGVPDIFLPLDGGG